MKPKSAHSDTNLRRDRPQPPSIQDKTSVLQAYYTLLLLLLQLATYSSHRVTPPLLTLAKQFLLP